MDATFDDLAHWNMDLENKALGVQEYWQAYAAFTRAIASASVYERPYVYTGRNLRGQAPAGF